MRIVFQTSLHKAIQFDFGFKTKLFEQMYWLVIEIVIYQDWEIDDTEHGYVTGQYVLHSNHRFSFLMHPKHWNSIFKHTAFGHTNLQRIKSCIWFLIIK